MKKIIIVIVLVLALIGLKKIVKAQTIDTMKLIDKTCFVCSDKIQLGDTIISFKEIIKIVKETGPSESYYMFKNAQKVIRFRKIKTYKLAAIDEYNIYRRHQNAYRL